MLSKNKEEIEKRLQTSLVEKDTLCSSLEESFEKIHILQRQIRDQDMKLQTTEKTLERLKRENDTLCERLESVNNNKHNDFLNTRIKGLFYYFTQGNASHGQSSLHNEMDCDDEFTEDRLDANHQLIKEAKSVYNQLKSLYLQLNITQDGDSGLHSDLYLGSSSSPSNDDLRQGMLSSITDDITNLVMGLDVVQLKTLLEQSRASCIDQDDELRRRQDIILDLECKVSVNLIIFVVKKRLTLQILYSCQLKKLNYKVP